MESPTTPAQRRPARSLTIAHVDTETGFSGGEVQVFLLIDGLRAQGVRNVIFCPPGSRCAEEGRRRGLEVQTLVMRNDLHVLAAARLAGRLRTLRPSLVHLHTGRANWIGGIAARWAGVPAVTTRRMDRRVRPGVRTRWLYGSLVRRAVAISPAVARRLLEGGVPSARTGTIFSAVDPGALVPSRPKEQVRGAEGVAPDDVLLLVLARLDRRKGVDVLLEALARLERQAGWRLWIVGDGPERGALEQQSQRLGLEHRVGFLGRCDGVADLLAACDALVMPSRSEGLGIAALEAMAVGRPVVASRVGGLADAVVDGRTGLLVPAEDSAALAGALERIVTDADLRARLGAEGPARIAEGFLPDQMVDAYLALYEEVLGETRMR